MCGGLGKHSLARTWLRFVAVESVSGMLDSIVGSPVGSTRFDRAPLEVIAMHLDREGVGASRDNVSR